MITGTNGFLGKNLQKYLSEIHDVKSVKLRNSEQLDELENQILSFKPDVFINNGWSGGNTFNDVNSYEQFNNVNLGIELSTILSKLDDLYFIGVGSFAEYGIKNKTISETDSENPNNYYGVSKNMFKSFSETFCKVNNFKWLWIRPCYVYGQHDVSARLIPKVIHSCLNKEQLTLDSCNSIVDYLYVDDFVEAVSELISNECSGIFNICSGEKYKVRDIINRIQYIISDTNIILDSSKDRKDSYTNFICGDNQKLMELTSWKPKFNLQNGLEKTIDLYKEKINEK